MTDEYIESSLIYNLVIVNPLYLKYIAYLDNHNILSDNQHGFRAGRSTTTAMFNMLKSLYENWSMKENSMCIYIDFSHAFDSLDHDILISKLKLYGLDENSLSFMRSYIDNRYQCTVVHGYTSTVQKLRYGTAQGSILGPLIFILYVNDLFKQIEKDKSILMYADDTLLINRGNNIHETISRSQDMLDKVVKWCRIN